MFTLGWLALSALVCLTLWNRPVWVLTFIVLSRIAIPGLASGILMPFFHPSLYTLILHLVVQFLFARPRVRRALSRSGWILAAAAALSAYGALDIINPYGAGVTSILRLVADVILLPALMFALIRDEVTERPASERFILGGLMAMGVFQVALGHQQMQTNTVILWERLNQVSWWWNDEVFRALGTTGHGIQLGLLLAGLIALTLRLRWLWLRFGLALLFLYGILLAEARLSLFLGAATAAAVVIGSLWRSPLRSVLYLAVSSAGLSAVLASEAFRRIQAKFDDDQGSNELRFEALRWAADNARYFTWWGYSGSRDVTGAGYLDSSLENGYLLVAMPFGLVCAALLLVWHLWLVGAPLVRNSFGRALPGALAGAVTIVGFFGSSSFGAQALEGFTLFVFVGLAWVTAPRPADPDLAAATDAAGTGRGHPAGRSHARPAAVRR